MPKNPTFNIPQGSARLCRWLTFLLIVLSVMLVLEHFSAVVIQFFKDGFAAESLRRFAFACVTACPEIFYLLALWGIRQAMASFARNELFAPTLTRMLERVGTMLATGALISVFLLPGAARLLGFGAGYWIAFDISGLVLGAIGLSLSVIAHVLRHAGELQAELDEIF